MCKYGEYLILLIHYFINKVGIINDERKLGFARACKGFARERDHFSTLRNQSSFGLEADSKLSLERALLTASLLL